MIQALRIMKQTAIFAVAQMRAIHTWRTWLFGWLARLLTQVTFFALIGNFVGDTDTMRYILIGNAVVLVCLESMIAVTSMVDERSAGTLPLLMVAPTSHVPIYLGRGVHWLASGLASSLIAWFLLPPLLGVPLPWPQALYAVPLIVVVGLASYCYACFLSALTVRWMGLEWVVLNLGYLTIMTFCGVNVPVSFWPAPIELVVQVLPVTHGLEAVRTALNGGALSEVLALAGLELLVGLGWVLVAVLSIDRIVSKGRVDGSLEFGT